MSTGAFENWAGNISEIGAIYPFVGSEPFWVALGVVLWIAWHIVQIRIERQEYEEDLRRYGTKESLRKILGESDPGNP